MVKVSSYSMVSTAKKEEFYKKFGSKLPIGSDVGFEVNYDEVYKTKDNPDGKVEMVIVYHDEDRYGFTKDYFVYQENNWVFLTSKF